MALKISLSSRPIFLCCFYFPVRSPTTHSVDVCLQFLYGLGVCYWQKFVLAHSDDQQLWHYRTVMAMACSTSLSPFAPRSPSLSYANSQCGLNGGSYGDYSRLHRWFKCWCVDGSGMVALTHSHTHTFPHCCCCACASVFCATKQVLLNKVCHKFEVCPTKAGQLLCFTNLAATIRRRGMCGLSCKFLQLTSIGKALKKKTSAHSKFIKLCFPSQSN